MEQVPVDIDCYQCSKKQLLEPYGISSLFTKVLMEDWSVNSTKIVHSLADLDACASEKRRKTKVELYSQLVIFFDGHHAKQQHIEVSDK